MRASRWSYSPLNRVCTSKSPIALINESNSFDASSIAPASFSLLANSSKTGRSSNLCRSPEIRLISLCTRESLLVTFCASSGLSHKLGTPAAASSSFNSARNFGKSTTFSIDTNVALNVFISCSKSRAAISQRIYLICHAIRTRFRMNCCFINSKYRKLKWKWCVL